MGDEDTERKAERDEETETGPPSDQLVLLVQTERTHTSKKTKGSMEGKANLLFSPS